MTPISLVLSLISPSPRLSQFLESVCQEPSPTVEVAIAVIKELGEKLKEGMQAPGIGGVASIVAQRVSLLIPTSRLIANLAYAVLKTVPPDEAAASVSAPHGAELLCSMQGYELNAEPVLSRLETLLDDRAQGTLTKPIVWMQSLVFVRPPLPKLLPDLIGTRETPSSFCQRVDQRLALMLAEASPLIAAPVDEATREVERIRALAKISEWQTHWDLLKEQLYLKPKMELFAEDPIERTKQYIHFGYRLDLAFGALCEKGLESSFFESLAGFQGVCLPGWQERIEQLTAEGSTHYDQDLQLTALRIARDFRREILLTSCLRAALKSVDWSTDLLADPHYLAATKQWANENFVLGYSKEELGDPEPIVCFFESPVALTAMEKNFLIHYTVDALKGRLQAYYTELEGSRDLFLTPLLDAYQEAIIDQQETPLQAVPLIDEMSHLKPLYRDLALALAVENPFERSAKLNELHAAFQFAGVVEVSYTALSLRQSLIKEFLYSEAQLAFWLSSALRRSIQDKTIDLKVLVELLQDGLRSFQAAEVVESMTPADQKKLRVSEEWLTKLALSETKEAEDSFALLQLQRAAEMAKGLPARIALENRRLLERKLISGGKLTPFGLEIWLSAAGLTTISSTRLSRAESLLAWASAQLLPSLQEAIITKLEEVPSNYLHLPLKARQLPEVLKKAKANRGLIYGLSEVDYQRVMIDPKKGLLDSRFPILQDQKEWLREVISKDGLLLEYTSTKWREDRELALLAVTENGLALRFVNQSLINDHEILLAAVRQNGLALSLANDHYKDTLEVVQAAVESDGMALEHASTRLRSNKNLVMIAIQSNPSALNYAAPHLCNNDAVVLLAVQQDGLALEYASPRLRHQSAMAMRAVTRNGGALAYCSEDLQADPAVVLVAVQLDGLALEYASNALREDRAIVLAAVTQNGGALEYARGPLIGDKALVLIAVANDGWALTYASVALKNDRDVVIAAVKQNSRALYHASATLQEDPEVMAIANFSVKRKRV